MVEHARIFYAEDSRVVRNAMRLNLQDLGHEIIVEVTTLDDGLEQINKAVELGVNVAIIDGNLRPMDISCEDGRKLSSALKEAIPSIVIIANPGGEIDPDYGDIIITKNERGAIAKIIDAIESIPEV